MKPSILDLTIGCKYDQYILMIFCPRNNRKEPIFRPEAQYDGEIPAAFQHLSFLLSKRFEIVASLPISSSEMFDMKINILSTLFTNLTLYIDPKIP